MKLEQKLWKHQEEAIARAKSRDSFALFFEPGCLSEDTVVKVSRCGALRKKTIAELYLSFNNLNKHGGYSHDHPTLVRSWTGDRIRLHKISKVVKSGVKPLVEVSAGSKKIKVTKDHEILTKRGWVEASKLKVKSDLVAVDSLTRHTKKRKKTGYNHFGHGLIKWVEVKSVKPKKPQMTYDIVCEDPHRNFVANDIVVHNCGKTLTTLNILKDKYTQERQLLNTLILAPLVVLDQWKEEIRKVPEIPIGLVSVLKGSSVEKNREFEKMLEIGHKFIAVTNYESLYNKTLFDNLHNWLDVLVCDESSKLKERSAKRTKQAIKLSKKAKYRYLLSGTPILASLLDIFSQYLILDQGKTFGGNYFVFRSTYFQDKNAGWKGRQNYWPNWGPKPGASHDVSEKIKPSAMHVRKKDAIDLPAYVKKNIYVEMGREQAKAYAEMRDYLVTVIKDKTCMADMVLTKLLRLQQIVSGFIRFDDNRDKSFQECPRVDALSEILQEVVPVEKVIVWCVFKKNYDQVKSVCNKLQLDYCELTGETKDKAASIEKFNTDDNCRVMIANQQAGGIGVNLTAAGTAIFFSKNFSLEADVQAEARNYRGGSLAYGHKKITRIDLVCRGTVDEIINSAIEAKVKTNDEVLSLLRDKL